jgi:DNA polymerase III epsilon subunit family exonuclease
MRKNCKLSGIDMKAFIVIIFLSLFAYLIYKLATRKSGASTATPEPNVYLPKEFMVVDLETTGLSSDTDHIIEIGVIRVNPLSNYHTTLQLFIKPSEPISAKITEITGITNGMLDKEGEPLDEAWKQFIEFIGELPLVFYNAPFDMGFIQKVANETGTPFHNEVIDALPMCRKAFPHFENHKLGTVARQFNISTSGAHRALKDCELTLHVYNFASQQLQARSIGSWYDSKKVKRAPRPKPAEKPFDNTIVLARTKDQQYSQALDLESEGYIENAMGIYQKLADQLYDASTPYNRLKIYYRKIKAYDPEIAVIEKQIAMYTSPKSYQRTNIPKRVVDLNRRIELVKGKKAKAEQKSSKK